jgi:hypothetical protein
MKFGNFIQDGLGGLLTFTHDYFKEAVQTLLLSTTCLLNKHFRNHFITDLISL